MADYHGLTANKLDGSKITLAPFDARCICACYPFGDALNISVESYKQVVADASGVLMTVDYSHNFNQGFEDG